MLIGAALGSLVASGGDAHEIAHLQILFQISKSMFIRGTSSLLESSAVAKSGRIFLPFKAR